MLAGGDAGSAQKNPDLARLDERSFWQVAQLVFLHSRTWCINSCFICVGEGGA